jgi:hypothetical protein
MPAPPQFRALLEVLARHQVDFIVVGGVAGVLQGAPLLTRDLDIVYRLADEKLTRPKDRLALLQLRATLAEREKS